MSSQPLHMPDFSQVRARADIILFCPSCSRPDVDPVAESTRVAESETDILESEESYPS